MKKIRYAVPGDARALAEIHAAAWEKAYQGLIPETHAEAGDIEVSEARYLRTIGSRTEDAVVVEEDGEICGFTVIGPGRDSDTVAENPGEIRGLYISPDHWRQGLGKMLTEWSLQELRKQGFGIATLWVLERSEMAARFYESMGFTRDGAVREIGPGAPRVVRYRKVLRPA